MPTPSLQTLVTDAQAVLALQNMTTIRSTMAVALANANTGTPLNPGLTNQQLINEACQVMTLPKSDIESIIVNQLMKFLNSPPAPGGVGANKQVIWNNAGVLTGDPNFTWDGPLSLLNVTGAATITGNLTVDTSTLKVDSANNRVGIGTATPARPLDIVGSFQSTLGWALVGTPVGLGAATRYIGGAGGTDSWYFNALTGGNHLWAFGEVEAMRLNSTGLGVGVSPAAKFDSLVADGAESARFRAASGWLRIHPYLNATDVCRLQSTNNTNTGLQTLSLEGFSLRFNTNLGAAMIIDNLMNTLSNVNSAVPALSTNNQMVFNLTSNTNLRISVRGSDGVTRTTNITLA